MTVSKKKKKKVKNSTSQPKNPVRSSLTCKSLEYVLQAQLNYVLQFQEKMKSSDEISSRLKGKAIIANDGKWKRLLS